MLPQLLPLSRWRGRAVAVAVAFGALGCSPESAGEARGSRAQAIVQGEPSSADQDGVLLLRAVLDQGEILCSASLVAPNLIMTARHCVAYTTDGQFSCSVRGELSDNPTGGGRVGLHLPAASLEVYGGKKPRKAPLARGQRVLSTLSPTVCENDLAFVVLDTALDLPVVAMRLDGPAQLHERATLVGYGSTSDEQIIDYETQPRLQKPGLEVTGVGLDSIQDGVTTVPPRVLFLDGPSGCIGDSGGPLLAESSGAVIGVYSLQRGGSCAVPGVRHHLVHVPAFHALIDEAFAASGGEPLREPPAAATGAGGAGGAPDDPASEGGVEWSSPSAGVSGAAGESARDPEPEPEASASSGCTVAVAPGEGGAAWCALAAMVVGVLGRRRQRRG